MKLHEIHQDHEPLVVIMLRKLLSKRNHISLGVAKPDGTLAHEGWITSIDWEDGTGDYEIHYSQQVNGDRQMYFTTASHLETFNLVKDDDEENVWHLQGDWEMPKGWVGEAVEDEEPLIITVMRNLLIQNKPLFAQRTKGSMTSSHQAIFPVKSLRWDNEKRELAVSITELVPKAGVMSERPATIHILDRNVPIDTRWTLSKTKHGTVLHVSNTPVSDMRDGDEAK